LLGLAANASYDAGLKPDYTLDAATVYKRSVLATSVARRNASITNLTLPSWVPDWSCPSTAHSLILTELGSIVGPLPSASGKSRAHGKWSHNADMLDVMGHMVDLISETACVMDVTSAIYFAAREYSPSTEAHEVLFEDVHRRSDDVLEWEALTIPRRKSIYQPTNEPMIDVFWKKLARGNIRDVSNGSKQNFHKWYRIYLPHSRSRRLMGSRIGKGPVFDSLFNASVLRRRSRCPEFGVKFEKVLGITHHRRLARTKGGFLGLVDAESQIGDSVAISKGGRTPLILRPRGEHWELIGDSYMHGMMNGELYDEKRCELIWLV
jgi:hypothetical protein